MAIFHLSIKIVSRSSGKGAVAAAAYRAGVKLEEKETGYTHDYTRKSSVIYSGNFSPSQCTTGISEPGNSLERGAESGKEIGCPACKGN